MGNVLSKQIEIIYMGLKVLPQFIEELDSAYTREDSKYFLGFDKIDDFPSILKYIDKLTLEESVLFSSYMESAEIVYAWMGVTDCSRRTTIDYAKAEWRMTYPNYFMIFTLAITLLF